VIQKAVGRLWRFPQNPNGIRSSSPGLVAQRPTLGTSASAASATLQGLNHHRCNPFGVANTGFDADPGLPAASSGNPGLDDATPSAYRLDCTQREPIGVANPSPSPSLRGRGIQGKAGARLSSAHRAPFGNSLGNASGGAAAADDGA
jgi:hypothetical protein